MDPQASRTIYVNDPEKNLPSRFPTNFVRTSKYTIVSYIPKSLLIQFRRVANFYFLATAILQSIEIISPLSPFSAITPLCLVLGISMLREGLDDWKRHKADKEANNEATKVLVNGAFVATTWADIKVGDILQVDSSEMFPADLVLLATSDPLGGCYIETANLDGERALKPRGCIKQTVELITSPEKADEFKGVIRCEQPNNRLYQFEGTVAFETGGVEFPLDTRQLLLRGASLRNTHWVIGVVVFTGAESKLMMNANAARFKSSNIERTVNNLVLTILAMQTALCLFFAACSGLWTGIYGYDLPYLSASLHTPAAFEGVLIYFGYFLLLNTMIPISLIVSLEIVKVIQAFFIEMDLEMYYEPLDAPARAVSSNLNEELGQIKYLFSDKTGTLTSNTMEFKVASIGGVIYGDDSVTLSAKALDAIGEDDLAEEDEEPLLDAAKDKSDIPWGFKEDILLADLAQSKQVDKSISVSSMYSTRSELIYEFLTALAICHDVVPEMEKGKLVYQGSSPDEVTLVDAARQLGFFFHKRVHNLIHVTVQGREVVYEILNVVEFSSSRKRMSVVVRCPDGKLKLFCKGADSIILSRLSKDIKQPNVEATKEHLLYFSKQGLRTLCIAVAHLEEEKYQVWNEQFKLASLALSDRENKISEAAESMERNLYLLGSTGVEDKLQDGVPECIEALSQGGINVWMLTGDKLETAVNIGMSCRLLTDDMHILTLNTTTKNDTRLELAKLYAIYEEKTAQRIPVALVADGTCLDYALEEDLEYDLLCLAAGCKSVICCRVSPLQKAAMVQLVKKYLVSITLAIGDGANDVSMIQAAHIGVGILGKEGRQAANSSDYCIAQFRFLWRLLFVHGRWSYVRIAHFILYFFYKNIAFTLCQFWFGFMNGFSAQTVFEDWYLTLYNTIFTAIGLVVRAVLEQDVNPHDSAYIKSVFPKLYSESQGNKHFTYSKFWNWFIFGVYHSLVVFLVPMFVFTNPALSSSGYTVGLWDFSLTVYSCVVLVVTLKLALDTEYWTWVTHVAVWVLTFPVIFYAFAFIYEQFDWSFMYLVANQIMATPQYWFCLLLAAALCLLPDLAYKSYLRMYQPSPTTILQEMRMLDRQKKRKNRKTAAGGDHSVMTNGHVNSHVNGHVNGQENSSSGHGGSVELTSVGRSIRNKPNQE